MLSKKIKKYPHIPPVTWIDRLKRKYTKKILFRFPKRFLAHGTTVFSPWNKSREKFSSFHLIPLPTSNKFSNSFFFSLQHFLFLCLCAMKNLIFFRYEKIINWQMLKMKQRNKKSRDNKLKNMMRTCKEVILDFFSSPSRKKTQQNILCFENYKAFASSQSGKNPKKWRERERKIRRS